MWPRLWTIQEVGAHNLRTSAARTYSIHNGDRGASELTGKP